MSNENEPTDNDPIQPVYNEDSEVTVSRRRALQLVFGGAGATTLSELSVAQESENSGSVIGSVSDLKENPVSDANVYIYGFDQDPTDGRFNMMMVNDTKTDESGNWSTNIDIESVAESVTSSAEPEDVGILLIIKKNEWFGTNKYLLNEFVEQYHSQSLNKKYVLDNYHIGANPIEGLDIDKNPPYYATISVWRDFSSGSDRIDTIRYVLHNATLNEILNSTPGRFAGRLGVTPTRYKTAVLSTTVKENVHISNPSHSNSAIPNPLNAGVVPHSSNEGRAVNDDEFFIEHANADLSGPISPATAHSQLKSKYISPSETGLSGGKKVVSIIGNMIIGTALGAIPPAGATLGLAQSTATALNSIFDGQGAISLAENSEQYFEGDIGADAASLDTDINDTDSIKFGYDHQFGGPVSAISGQSDSFDSMTYSVRLDWKETQPDEINLTTNGLLRRTKSLSGNLVDKSGNLVDNFSFDSSQDAAFEIVNVISPEVQLPTGNTYRMNTGDSTNESVNTGASEVITRTNSDGDVYQSGRVTESPDTLSAGSTVSVSIRITAEIQKANDNIIYGAVGSSDGEIYEIEVMPGTGSGSINIAASLPQESDIDIYWTWVPATNISDARNRASRSLQSKTDSRGEPIAIQLGQTD
jgi:hypothetical protein